MKLRLFRRRDWHIVSVSPMGGHYLHRKCWSKYAAEILAAEANSAHDGWFYYVRHVTESYPKVLEVAA